MNIESIAANHDAIIILAQDYPVGHKINVVDAHTCRQVKSAIKAQQAIIDRLMLEYCPNEITPSQFKEWVDSQRRVPVCACCGTTENLHNDLGCGGPYRCSSPTCVVF